MAPRNVTRARVRLSLEEACGQVGEDEVPRNHDGNVIAEPPMANRSRRSPTTPSLPSPLYRYWARRGIRTFGKTAKREPSFAPPAEPKPEVAKTAIPESQEEDMAFTPRHAMGIPAAQLINVSH